MSQTYVYPFDPTGSLTSNVIPNERHVLSGVTDREFNFIVPTFAPFFRNNLRIRHLGMGRDLVEGVDYHLTHWFHAASHGVGRPVYGSITYLDRSLTGVVELRYQTIGGDWVYDENTVLELMSNRLMNPRITTWEQVVDLPFQFPVIDHQWNLDDLTGAKDIVAKLNGITEAINAANDANGTSHVADYNNPHRVNKVQIGLGLVENYPMANIAEAVAGSSNALYMTPVRVRNFVEAYVTPLLEGHTLRNDNPHGVTKTQVGLGSVQNFGIASPEQAAAGTSNVLYLTPVGLKASLDANIVPVISAHTSRIDNPHGTTKAQVGLGNVENLPLASQAEAVAGSRNDRYMTPLSTYQMVSQYVGEGMNNHISDLNNPHRVSKAQVGLGNVLNYGIATDAQMVAGTADNLYTTPKGVRLAIEEVALASYRAHTNDGNNPHGTTKAQVGLNNVDNYPTATRAEAVAGTATNRFMTPATTQAMLENIVGDSVGSHVGRTDNPHAVTKVQVGLGNVENYGVASQVEALEGTSSELYMTPVTSWQVAQSAARNLLQQHSERTDNPHQVTAAQLGAVTTTALETKLLGYMTNGSKASDSALLNGYSYEQIMAAVSGGEAENTERFGGYTVPELQDIYTTHIAPLATRLEGKSYSDIESGILAKVHSPVSVKYPGYESENSELRAWTRLFTTRETRFEAVISLHEQDDARSSTSLLKFVDADGSNGAYREAKQVVITGEDGGHVLYIKNVGENLEVWLESGDRMRGDIHCMLVSATNNTAFEFSGETFEAEPDWSQWDEETAEEPAITPTKVTLIDNVMLEARLDAFAEEMRQEAIDATGPVPE